MNIPPFNVNGLQELLAHISDAPHELRKEIDATLEAIQRNPAAPDGVPVVRARGKRATRGSMSRMIASGPEGYKITYSYEERTVIRHDGTTYPVHVLDFETCLRVIC